MAVWLCTGVPEQDDRLEDDEIRGLLLQNQLLYSNLASLTTLQTQLTTSGQLELYGVPVVVVILNDRHGWASKGV